VLHRAPVPLILGIGAAGVAAGIAVAAYLLSTEAAPDRERWAVLVLVTNGSFVTVGTLAWLRRPGNWIGPLMVATGIALVARPVWPVASNSLLYTVTLAVSLLGLGIFVQLLLAFPEGRLHSGFERLLVAAAYTTVTVVQLLMLLVMHDPFGRNLLHTFHAAELHDRLMRNQERFIVLVLVGALAVLVRRWLHASPPFRRAIEPVLLTGGISVSLLAATLVVQESDAEQALTVGEVAYGALALVPLGFAAGLMLARYARRRIGKLVVELGETKGPSRLRDALAQALGDPSLRVAYAITDGIGFVGGDGRTIDVSAREGRAVTMVERDGRPVAALIHDPALTENPGLVDAVRAAAGLALENERLQAELRAQLEEVRDSRARIVEAGDTARRRIERDLHDGAQQRLVTLALELGLVESKVKADPDKAATLVAAARERLNEALEELRELARGIHPSILIERGLAAAVESLAERAPMDVTLEVERDDGDRLPLPVEAAAYYVVAEALTNVAKYARATETHVRVGRTTRRLRVEVLDDGVGGANPASGSGLRGLADRVEALDGSFQITSAQGSGTRIVVELPLRVRHATPQAWSGGGAGAVRQA
jgi:signal transduction histidine kinase